MCLEPSVATTLTDERRPRLELEVFQLVDVIPLGGPHDRIDHATARIS